MEAMSDCPEPAPGVLLLFCFNLHHNQLACMPKYFYLLLLLVLNPVQCVNTFHLLHVWLLEHPMNPLSGNNLYVLVECYIIVSCSAQLRTFIPIWWQFVYFCLYLMLLVTLGTLSLLFVVDLEYT